MAITSATNLFFAAIVMIFLITFFTPDEAATIYCQAGFLFLVIIQVIGNGIITGIAAIVYVFQALAHSIVSSLFNIDLDPETVLVLQSDALTGWESFVIGLKTFLRTIADGFEDLLDIVIVYEPYQDLRDVADIIIDSADVIVTTNIVTMLIADLLIWLWPVIDGFNDGFEYLFTGLANANSILEVGLAVASFLFISGVVESFDYFFQGLFGGIDSIFLGDIIGGIVQMGDGLLGGIVGIADTAIGTGVAIADTVIGTGVATADAVIGGVVEVADGVIDFICFWC